MEITRVINTGWIFNLLIIAVIIFSGAWYFDVINNTQKHEISTAALNAVSNIVVIKGSDQYNRMYPTVTATTIPTTEPTPEPIDVYKVFNQNQSNAEARALLSGASRIVPVTTSDSTNPVLNLKQPFQFHGNESIGTGTFDASMTVYRVKSFKNFTYHSYNTGRNYIAIAPDGFTYLFVFVRIWLDNSHGQKAQIWIPDESHFIVSTNGQAYYPDTTDLNPTNYVQELILNNVMDMSNTVLTKPYGYTRVYVGAETIKSISDNPCGTYEVGNATYYYTCNYEEDGGYRTNKTGMLYPGQSNAEDGYILFKVPDTWQSTDTRVLSAIYTFGTPQWEIGTLPGAIVYQAVTPASIAVTTKVPQPVLTLN